MQHLLNCHGEWNMLIAIASSVPFISVWIKHTISTHKHEEEQ
jgi:hypothetical protein